MQYLVTNEWGWVGYEELSRSRRVGAKACLPSSMLSSPRGSQNFICCRFKFCSRCRDSVSCLWELCSRSWSSLSCLCKFSSSCCTYLNGLWKFSSRTWKSLNCPVSNSEVRLVEFASRRSCIFSERIIQKRYKAIKITWVPWANRLRFTRSIWFYLKKNLDLTENALHFFSWNWVTTVHKRNIDE